VPNITLSVDEATIKKVRKVALDRDTTLTAMVRDYLTTVAASEDQDRRQRLRDLEDSFAALSRPMGPRTWTRDELHAR